MTKSFLTLAIAATWRLLPAQTPTADSIVWPPHYAPANSKFFVHNEVEISAGPNVVWQHLVDALNWPTWYKGAKEVAFVTAKDSVLQPHSVFKWRTMGLAFESAVAQFEYARLLAWESRKKSIQGYHVWLLVPTEKGCKVITDESQNGWLTFFEKLFQRKKLKRLHNRWLAALKKRSEQTSLIP